MSDDLKKETPAQRNQEPRAVSTTLTGNHATGNYLTPQADVDAVAPSIQANGLVWIEKEDDAKQGMARKGDMRNARAAPDKPHIGHVRGSGESQ
ncbi:MAG: hypothetical protein ACOY93_17200 [Bacillota bacterium]